MQDSLASYTLGQLIGAWGASSVVLCGLATWLGGLIAGRIARSESHKHSQELETMRSNLALVNEEVKSRLGAALDRVVLVDKVRFEHEYDVYQQVWEKLYPLQQATLDLRPRFARVAGVDVRPSEEAMHKFTLAANAFRPVVEKHRPFYPQALYEALMEIYFACAGELIDARDAGPSPETLVEASAARQRILERVEDACTAVRARLDEVRVI